MVADGLWGQRPERLGLAVDAAAQRVRIEALPQQDVAFPGRRVLQALQILKGQHPRRLEGGVG